MLATNVPPCRDILADICQRLSKVELLLQQLVKSLPALDIAALTSVVEEAASSTLLAPAARSNDGQSGPRLQSSECDSDSAGLTPATRRPATSRRSRTGFGFDVDAVIDGLRLKAAATSWAAQRRRMLADGADLRLEIIPQDHEFIHKAKAAGIYLWMLARTARLPADICDYDLISTGFTTLADALDLADAVLTSEYTKSDDIEESLTLLARAQSALRTAVARCPGQTDVDQRQIFQSVRETADRLQIYIPSGLRSNDPVDPVEIHDISTGVQLFKQSFAAREQACRRTMKLLKNLAFKAKELAATADVHADCWVDLVRLVEELIASGFQPSRIELRDALLPIADRLPSQVIVSKEFGLVLREIERFRSRSAPDLKVTASDVPTEEVSRVAGLLKGRTLVLIGGEERTDAATAIERAFGLKRVVWISTADHESYRNFEPQIARRDVAVVVLMIRWANHSFGNVRTLCDRHRKPLVRLPNGYNPNQVAAAILSQASNRISRAI